MERRRLAASPYSDKQLHALRVCGTLGVALYALLLVAIAWRTVLHFRRGGPRAPKTLFHLGLLLTAALCLVDPASWLAHPDSQSWVYAYLARLYALLGQCLCKSYLAVCWAGVVSAGQTRERRRAGATVLALNGALCVWAVVAPVLLSGFQDDLYGQYAFVRSASRAAMTYVVVAVVLAYAALLVYQAARLRRRLLLARGTVPVGSVEKSLYQLLLTVAVFLVADLLRVVSLALYDSGGAALSILSYLVLNSLVPNIFPAICMLYLMRRLPSPRANAKDPKLAGQRARGDEATLSRYMSESDGGLGIGIGNGGDDGFALGDSRVLAHSRQQAPASLGAPAPSPAFCRVRE